MLEQYNGFLMKLPVIFCLAGGILLAQETPTERQAARDVLSKMSELERALDVRTIVERLTVSNAQRDQTVARAKELMDKELLRSEEHTSELQSRENLVCRL